MRKRGRTSSSHFQPQHRIVKGITAESLAVEFGTRVLAIGRLLPMLEPWREPVYLKRAW